MSVSSLPSRPELSRGELKIFLGYAAGVGKTYQMLVDAQLMKEQGLDIIIGYFEPHNRPDTIAKTEGLETVPRKIIEHRGARLEEMDTGAILRRNPQICVVDEFAHTNAPGSPRAKRWEDVMILLDAGITVLTSMNVQHIESLNDQIWQMTGVRVRETVPDWVINEADDVVMVDLTPRALLNRLERGVVYPPEKVRAALQNFFTESNLIALRELALRQAAHQVEDQREELQYEYPAIVPNPNRGKERILIWLTDDPAAAMLIRRGRRVADYLQSECLAVAVSDDHRDPKAKAQLDRHLNFSRNMRITPEVISAKDAAAAVADYARNHGITQIFVTRHVPDLLKLVRLVRDLQVTIVSERPR